MHKHPKDRMWLPTGGQLKRITYVNPLRHKEEKSLDLAIHVLKNYMLLAGGDNLIET